MGVLADLENVKMDKPIVTEEKKQTEIAKEDMAAAVFMRFEPLFLKSLETVSQKGIARVLKALVIHPFNKVPIKFQSTLEDDLYQLSKQLLESKDVLLEAIQKQKGDQNGSTNKNDETSDSRVSSNVESNGNSGSGEQKTSN